jgi:hypothetical protein
MKRIFFIGRRDRMGHCHIWGASAVEITHFPDGMNPAS